MLLLSQRLRHAVGVGQRRQRRDRPRLQQVQLAAVDGPLDVLRPAEVLAARGGPSCGDGAAPARRQGRLRRLSRRQRSTRATAFAALGSSRDARSFSAAIRVRAMSRRRLDVLGVGVGVADTRAVPRPNTADTTCDPGARSPGRPRTRRRRRRRRPSAARAPPAAAARAAACSRR